MAKLLMAVGAKPTGKHHRVSAEFYKNHASIKQAVANIMGGIAAHRKAGRDDEPFRVELWDDGGSKYGIRFFFPEGALRTETILGPG